MTAEEAVKEEVREAKIAGKLTMLFHDEAYCYRAAAVSREERLRKIGEGLKFIREGIRYTILEDKRAFVGKIEELLSLAKGEKEPKETHPEGGKA